MVDLDRGIGLVFFAAEIDRLWGEFFEDDLDVEGGEESVDCGGGFGDCEFFGGGEEGGGVFDCPERHGE